MAKAAKTAKADGAPSAPKQQKKRYPIKWIALAIIILAIVYIYFEFAGLPLAVLSAQQSGQQLNSTTLQGIMFQKVNSMPAATANYSGSINIKNDPPFNFSFSKYGNHTRISFSVQNLTGFGTVMMLYIGNGPLGSQMNGTVCLNSWGGQSGYDSAHGNYWGGFADSMVMDEIRSTGKWENPYYCLNTNGNGTIINGFLNSFINLTSLSNITTNGYGFNFAKGCYVVSGRGNIEVNSTIVGAFGADPYTPATLNFSACLSGSNNLPVSFNANLTAHDTGIPYGTSGNDTIVNETLFTGTQLTSAPPGYTEYFCNGVGGGGVVNWTTDASAYNSTWLGAHSAAFGELYLNYYTVNFASIGHKNESVCSTSLYRPNAVLNAFEPVSDNPGAPPTGASYDEQCTGAPTSLSCNDSTRYFITCLNGAGCNNTNPDFGKVYKSNLYAITCGGAALCNATNQQLHYIAANQSYNVPGTNTMINYDRIYNNGGLAEYPMQYGPALTSVGLLNPPQYTMVGKIEVSNDISKDYYMNYSIPENRSFSLISLACANGCAVTSPTGCEMVASNSNGYGRAVVNYGLVDTNYMFLCVQNAAAYSVRIRSGTTSFVSYIAGAVYDFGPAGNTTIDVALNQAAFTQTATQSQVTTLP